LWYVLRGEAGQVTSFDETEFDAIKWLSLDQVLATPEDTLDPHMHRFTRKLVSLLALQEHAVMASDHQEMTCLT
jgi:hypothetical protein